MKKEKTPPPVLQTEDGNRHGYVLVFIKYNTAAEKTQVGKLTKIRAVIP